MRLSFAASLLLALAGTQLASSASSSSCNLAYSQCGGQNWSGATCCVSGYECKFQNDYYSQCLPSTGSSSYSSASHGTTTTSTATTSKATTSSTKASSYSTSVKAETTSAPASSSSSATVSSASSSSSYSSSSSGDDYSPVEGGASGSGTTTRYWDCCKASCSWPGKASVSSPVGTCAKDGVTLIDANTQSGCNGGSGYMCNNNQPIEISDELAYGFAAASISGQSESDWCCACYELTFTSGPVEGKTMVVQITNTGGDLGNNHFDLQLPGGGVGLFNGCSSQWNAPADGWGARHGGVSSKSDCSQLPKELQAGCEFRFDWFQNADNPTVSFKQVTCPAELTKRTGCERS